MALSTRHILSIRDLSSRDIDLIFQTADSFREISERDIKKVPTLRGRTVINAFFEDSTRTRLSFEIAGKRLSADTINISTSGSAMAKKGESFGDTVLNLEAMNPDILIIRHNQAGAPLLASKLIKKGHVINAGDGMHEHPTQALLDLFTIREKLGRVKGLKVGIVGDVAHSRVARSDMLLFRKMGLKVYLCGPLTLMPPSVEAEYGVTWVPSFDDIIPKLDVLIALRIQKERLEEHLFPSLREYARYFGINEKRLKKAKTELLIMHPGPVNRGIELSPDVIDGPRSVILDQVTNGVAIRMAILYLLLGGEGEKGT
ncbi:MAG: aspartate carbamoyltransferase [Deltaproteobacteria bacterium RIFCSPLOWO2_02_FULL_44_10]|nr:MAG: aspartate carbamoyltransferase [Deltaproteobacteria bacterium RIFCSPHIGHO2_02_FULL_44_16]OGQ46581.1 MAG: aspartate carbamoyltransferase [Deltaproteobacteria bacterium RIFCSPLOWO2_02_FULL_44_10]